MATPVSSEANHMEQCVFYFVYIHIHVCSVARKKIVSAPQIIFCLTRVCNTHPLQMTEPHAYIQECTSVREMTHAYTHTHTCTETCVHIYL